MKGNAMESVRQRGLSSGVRAEIKRHGPQTVINNRVNMARQAQTVKFANELLAEVDQIRREYSLK